MTQPSPTCPDCGAPLPADSPQQLCPACLMRQALASRTHVAEGARVRVMPPPSPAEIAGKFPQFEILECLGRGGMGAVYKARQKSLNRIVAIKILAPEREHDRRFAERFAREAEMLAQLSHPHIVTIHDFGETEGLFYIVMEFVDGVNLRALLRDGKVSPRQALAIVPPICDALQYAHEQGIVHRDIKPENLLLDRQGRVKIADFGIAALVGLPGEIAGTPPYMAPEQSGPHPEVDHRADIYALGVVLYEMLTGERPGREIIAPSQKVQVDVRLDEIVLRALERSPEMRYRTASEFRTQVETMVSSTLETHSADPRVGQWFARFLVRAVYAVAILAAGWPLIGLAISFHNRNHLPRFAMCWAAALGIAILGKLLSVAFFGRAPTKPVPRPGRAPISVRTKLACGLVFAGLGAALVLSLHARPMARLHARNMLSTTASDRVVSEAVHEVLDQLRPLHRDAAGQMRFPNGTSEDKTFQEWARGTGDATEKLLSFEDSKGRRVTIREYKKSASDETLITWEYAGGGDVQAISEIIQTELAQRGVALAGNGPIKDFLRIGSTVALPTRATLAPPDFSKDPFVAATPSSTPTAAAPSAKPEPSAVEEAQREVLKLELEQAMKEADRVQARFKAGTVDSLEVETARVEMLKAQLSGDPVLAAKAALDTASRRLEMMKPQFEAGIITSEEFEKSKNEVALAKARLRVATTQADAQAEKRAEQIDKLVLDLVAPVDVTNVDVYHDGGTVAWIFKDARGTNLEMCLDGREERDGPAVFFVGALHPTKPGAQALSQDGSAEKKVIQLLKDWISRSMDAGRAKELLRRSSVAELSTTEVAQMRILHVIVRAKRWNANPSAAVQEAEQAVASLQAPVEITRTDTGHSWQIIDWTMKDGKGTSLQFRMEGQEEHPGSDAILVRDMYFPGGEVQLVRSGASEKRVAQLLQDWLSRHVPKAKAKELRARNAADDRNDVAMSEGEVRQRCILSVVDRLERRDELTPWGEISANGVRVRLVEARRVWQEGETPSFTIHLRNVGDKEFAYVGWPEADCRVEVDGKWYGWPNTLQGTTLQKLAPSDEKAFSRALTLTEGWAQPRLQHQAVPGAPSGALTLTEGWAQPPGKWAPSLQLRPGRHTVRVAFQPYAAMSISNPVEIEIEPGGAVGKAVAFEPVLEMVLIDQQEKSGLVALDIDSRSMGSLWAMQLVGPDWIMKKGIDLTCARDGTPSQGLIATAGMTASQIPNEQWATIQPREVLANAVWKRPPFATATALVDKGTEGGNSVLPATFIFRTREGRMGVLQVTGLVEEPERGVRFRYKLVQTAVETALPDQDGKPVARTSAPRKLTPEEGQAAEQMMEAMQPKIEVSKIEMNREDETVSWLMTDAKGRTLHAWADSRPESDLSAGILVGTKARADAKGLPAGGAGEMKVVQALKSWMIWSKQEEQKEVAEMSPHYGWQTCVQAVLERQERRETVRLAEAMAGGQREAASAPDATVGRAPVPELRGIAWLDQLQSEIAPKAWSPKGRLVDRAALRLPDWINPLAKLKPAKAPAVIPSEAPTRSFCLWFCDPILDVQSFSEITLLDEAGKPLSAPANVDTLAQVIPARDSVTGWITATVCAGFAHRMPAAASVMLRYGSGLWSAVEVRPESTTVIEHMREQVKLVPIDPKPDEASPAEKGFQAEGEPGKVFIIATAQARRQMQHDCLAIMKDGRTMRANAVTTGGSPEAATRVFRFDTPLQEIARIRLLTRPVQVVTYPVPMGAAESP